MAEEFTDSRFIDFFADDGPTAEERMNQGAEEAASAVKKESEHGTIKDFFDDVPEAEGEEDGGDEEDGEGEGEGKTRASSKSKEVEEGDDDEGSGEEESEDSEPDEEEAPAPEEKPVKKDRYIKVKTEEETLKIPTEATLEIRANGEKVKVTLDELRDSYASKQANLSEFKKIKEEKAAFATRTREIEAKENEVKAYENGLQQVIVNFSKQVERGEAIPGVLALCEAAGVDGLPVIREIRNQLAETARAFLEMTPDERKLLDLEEELAYRKKRDEQERQKQQALASNQKYVQEYQHILQELNLTPQEGKVFGDELKALIDRGQIVLQDEQGNRRQFFTAQEFKGAYLAKRSYDLIIEAAPDAIADEELVADVRTLILRRPQATKEELLRVIRKVTGSATGNGKAEESKQKLSFKPKTNKTAASKSGKGSGFFL